MSETHEIFGGKVKVYKRPESDIWQCSACIDGRNWRKSTGKDSLSLAKDFAEDWYLGLRGKRLAGTLKGGKKIKEAAERFLVEYPVLTQGQRSKHWCNSIRLKVNSVIIPMIGDRYLSEGTKLVQEFRLARSVSKRGKPLAWSTMHQDMVVLRQIYKTALREGWIDHLPDFSAPYRASGKVTHRAWFSPQEYKLLYEATRERAANPKKERWRLVSENLHDFVLFMANTGLRPDEAWRLEYRDVTAVKDEATGERILEIEVRGKRGVGYCKSMPGAVRPFERMKKRNNPSTPLERIFQSRQRELFNAILDELDLKVDRDGQRRTAYSLRHTYISFRLMEGADIYQIAKNCRTSVEMIQKYYASHIKDMIDTAKVNVMKQKKAKRSRKPAAKTVDSDINL